MRILVAAAVATLIGTAAQAEEVLGIWMSEPNNNGGFVHVEIAPCEADAARLCGIIVDSGNLDPAKSDPERRETLIGKHIIRDMEADGANEWDNGTIWAPDDDKTYSSAMELESGVLEVMGCVFGGLICRGQDWTRVK